MKAETGGKIKFGSWGLVCGAIIAIVIGFVWGGWSTASTTAKISEKAVLASQSAICVAQFMKDPNQVEKIAEFEKISSWEKYKFIEKGGWDKMPGQQEADYGVARACSDGLEIIAKK